MQFRSFLSVSILALATAAGCAANTSDDAADGEQVLDTAEALSSESTAEDPVEDAVAASGDVDGAAGEAEAAGFDAPQPLDLGCGIRKAMRTRIKEHFDANGDGTLDASERQELADAVGDHPRAKLAFAKLGIKVRHHVWKRIVWAYDVDGSGSLEKDEKIALAKAVRARCEARKERILENWDADQDGQLDDGEMKAAIAAHVKARRERFFAMLAKIDTNDDGNIDDAERAAARAALVSRYQAKRDEVVEKYDANDDGTLDETELSSLKADIRARFENVPPGE
jgi:Ca2+-binding EF-hand superfamily protein